MASSYKKIGVSFVLTFFILLSLVLNLVKIVLKPVWRILMGSRVPVVVRTPEDRFNGLEKVGYNFAPNYLRFVETCHHYYFIQECFSIDGGCGVQLPRVHYLDEGLHDGPVIVCLHGEPAWSFLYRKMIPVLVDAGYRVIVPDFIGKY